MLIIQLNWLPNNYTGIYQPASSAFLVFLIYFLHFPETIDRFSLNELATWLFLSKFRHKVEGVFKGWTFPGADLHANKKDKRKKKKKTKKEEKGKEKEKEKESTEEGSGSEEEEEEAEEEEEEDGEEDDDEEKGKGKKKVFFSHQDRKTPEQLHREALGR